MKNKKLGIFNIALMYVGTIMGAGFASGREIWQFFGVFGELAYVGVGFAGLLFVLIGVMTSKISRRLGTNDMGKVIVPSGNKWLTNLVGYFMAFILFTVLVTMSAAGGALVNQQFGISRLVGGAIIIVLVLMTVLGGFDRVSHVFRYLMPILVAVVVMVSLMVVFSDLKVAEVSVKIKPSPLAPTWYLAALIYISYNVLAIIPIVSTASMHAKSGKHATVGVATGGIFLGFLAFVLVSAMLTQPTFSQAMDMPMLGFADALPKAVSILYTGVLMFAIYASATSNFYGFTTMLKQDRHKKVKIILAALAGFGFGLIGFVNVVAYMFPIEGFFGFAIILLLTVNFFRTGRVDNVQE